MRILAILMVGIVILTGVIIIDERQVAVITDYHGRQQTKLPGIHFVWPLLDKVTYVYINERAALLTLTINEADIAADPVQVEVLISYHVINPVIYLSQVNRLGKTGISAQIANILKSTITRKIRETTLTQFNQQNIVALGIAQLNQFGITIDQVALLNLKFIHNPALAESVNK